MSSDPVFSAFSAAGLWPGLGRTLAGELADAGINGPEDVSATTLAALPKVGTTRAGRLLSAFIAASSIYDVVALLVPAGVDARVAGRVVDSLGPGAARLLKDDPWQLLTAWGVTPADADRVARAISPDVQRNDPRRARALVGYVLARDARDGHTVSPGSAIVAALGDFGIGGAADGQAALLAAIDAGTVIASGKLTS